MGPDETDCRIQLAELTWLVLVYRNLMIPLMFIFTATWQCSGEK